MNIAVFLQDLNSGGAEKMMVEYANYLVNNTNDNVFLIIVREQGPYFDLIDPRIKTIILNKKKTMFSTLALRRTLINNNIDVVYTTLVNANIIALFVGKLTGVKIIIREANTIRENRKFESNILVKVANILSKYIYDWCTKCIAISESVKSDLLIYTNCPNEKISVIYNPIIIKDILDVKLNDDFFHICMVSRLAPQKNIDTICQIIEAVIKINSEVKFHFFGEGDRSQLDILIDKYNASDRILIHGFHLSYYSYVKQMDLFIHIPLWEGLGNSVTEVFNSGIPMILSNVKSGFSELIDPSFPNIHYVDPYDKDKIIDIIQDYTLNKIQINSNRIKLNLDKDETYKKYRALAV